MYFKEENIVIFWFPLRTNLHFFGENGPTWVTPSSSRAPIAAERPRASSNDQSASRARTWRACRADSLRVHASLDTCAVINNDCTLTLCYLVILPIYLYVRKSNLVLYKTSTNPCERWTLVIAAPTLTNLTGHYCLSATESWSFPSDSADETSVSRRGLHAKYLRRRLVIKNKCLHSIRMDTDKIKRWSPQCIVLFSMWCDRGGQVLILFWYDTRISRLHRYNYEKIIAVANCK